jgi:predicted metal-dependent phosphoesterase TrpH
MLIDLHTHTRPISWDSFLTPDELIERAKAAGLDGVVLCEHDFCWDPEEVRALAGRHGVKRYVYGMHRSSELAQVVEQAGGVMVASHPYRRQMPWHVRNDHDYEEALRRASRNPAYRYCTALEKINGRGTIKENTFATRLCEFMGMAGTGGSDCHARSDVGRCATYFDRDIKSMEDLIEELKGGRFQAVDLTARPAAG